VSRPVAPNRPPQGRTKRHGGTPVDQRVAVFDNDGTLWCEQPMPIQLDFILHRLASMVAADPTLPDRQPWKAVAEHDVACSAH
jgi:hypothetical protein